MHIGCVCVRARHERVCEFVSVRVNTAIFLLVDPLFVFLCLRFMFSWQLQAKKYVQVLLGCYMIFICNTLLSPQVTTILRIIQKHRKVKCFPLVNNVLFNML